MSAKKANETVTTTEDEVPVPAKRIKRAIDATSASRLDWNISSLVRRMENDTIDFSIQRGLVWEPKRDSKLIHSILIGWPIGVFFFNKTESGVFECLDSQQRGNAIYNFVKGNLKLHSTTPLVVGEDGEMVVVAKKKFADLPEDLQNRILQYGLLVQCFDNMTKEEKVEFFTRINSGKPVTAADISRVKVNSRQIFQDLGNHAAMEVALTRKQKNKMIGEDIVKNIWIMCFHDSKSLLDKDTSPVFEEITVTPEQRTMLEKILGYIKHFMGSTAEKPDIRKKVRAKTHIASLGYMAYLAIKSDMWEDDYTKKAIAFFNTNDGTASVSTAYNGSVTGGAKPEKITVRISEIESAMEK